MRLPFHVWVRGSDVSMNGQVSKLVCRVEAAPARSTVPNQEHDWPVSAAHGEGINGSALVRNLGNQDALAFDEVNDVVDRPKAGSMQQRGLHEEATKYLVKFVRDHSGHRLIAEGYYRLAQSCVLSKEALEGWHNARGPDGSSVDRALTCFGAETASTFGDLSRCVGTGCESPVKGCAADGGGPREWSRPR
jgi:hypothetical protein